MSINVFGLPVNDETVRRVFPNLTTPITARHRAEAAALYMHQENKMDNLSKYVYNIQPNRDKEAAGTFGMIYNATGNNLTFHSRHSYSGDLYQSFYPHLIQNGQWAGFFHWDLSHIRPSKEAIVYRGQTEAGAERYFILAWTTQIDGRNRKDNQAYTTIESTQPGTGYFDMIERYMDRLGNSYNRTNFSECFTAATLGTTGRSEFVGIMSLSGVIN